MSKKMNLSNKLYFSFFAFVIVSFFITITLLFIIYNNSINDNGKLLKDLTNMAKIIAERNWEKANKGLVSEEEAKESAYKTIRTLRYHDGQDYFWIQDKNNIMIMHATKPELDGKDVTNVTDPTGKKIFPMFTQLASQGGGFLQYVWDKPGHSKPQPKRSYVQPFEKWGWIIGTGTYIDDLTGGLKKLFFISIISYLLIVGILSIYVFKLIKKTTTGLTLISKGLTGGANQVSQASSELLSTSQQLSEASNEQAATIEETTSAVDELGSLTMRNADNSSKANDLSREVKHVVDQANTLMTNMVSAMGEIKSSSNEISKVIKVIDDIAFQTNILALNAAVEAARAGEAGAGFAVVADEVRNLAQRSAEAAKETSAMIENSLTKTEIGVRNTEEVDKILKQINESVETSTSLMEEVSVASQEQTKGLDEISRAIQQISTTAQSNASAAEETSASADDLTNQAEQLKTIVTQLNSILNGSEAEHTISTSFNSKNPIKKHTETYSPTQITKIKPELIIPMDNDDNFV